jgi:hypothetical protein
MTPEEQKTISTLALRRAQQQLLGKRQRLVWAVAFAQEPLSQLSPGRLYDLRLEFTVFLVWAGGRSFVGQSNEVALPSVEELDAAQAGFSQIIACVVKGEDILVGHYAVTLTLRAKNGRAHLSEGLNLKEVTVPEQARYGLARVLGELDRALMEAGYLGPIIKACPAPKVRGADAEPCGRWFVGRPNQVYCSSQCQTRAASRATRARASSEIPETKRGRRPRQPTAKG